MKNSRRVSVLCLPAAKTDIEESAPPHPSGVRLAILPDGNTRAPGGRTAGAKKVVEVATGLALGGEVSVCYVGTASPENIERRSKEFAEEMTHHFLVLGTRILRDGVFVSDGIRCTPHGNLGALRRRGGAWGRFSAAVEAVCESTRSVRNPRMDLYFGVNYPPSFLNDLDIPTLFRTGMEERGVVRASGIVPHVRGYCAGVATPWPAIEVGAIRAVLRAVHDRGAARLGGGYSLAESRAFLRVLSGLRPTAPIEVTLPVDCSVEEASLLSGDSELVSGHLRLEIEAKSSGLPIRVGGPEDALVTLRLAPSSLLLVRSRRHDAVLAPGQGDGIFALGGIQRG